MLGNTYHLFLRPGHERIERLGGLHRFMAWEGLTLTDSGGFQVFSLGERGPRPRRATASRRRRGAGGEGPPGSGRGPGLVTIREEGVTFRSHLDGSRQFLSPERATEVQLALGADVIMAFDECPPSLADRAYHERSLARTQRWLVRCREAWQAGSARRADEGRTPCALFGIAQGGLFPDLRARAIEEAAALDLPGYALGGYAVGETPEAMWEGVARDAPRLPPGKPRYLMGVGTPEDLLAGIAAGIDLFDCVLPTRCARNGLLFTSRASSPSGTPASPTTSARPTRPAAATPAAPSPAPTCATSSSPRSCWACGSTPSTTSPTTSRSWPTRAGPSRSGGSTPSAGSGWRRGRPAWRPEVTAAPPRPVSGCPRREIAVRNRRLFTHLPEQPCLPSSTPSSPRPPRVSPRASPTC